MSRDVERLVVLWRRAEERLYPIAMQRPETYEGYLRAIRALADRLGEVRSPEDLPQAWAERDRFLEEAIPGVGGGLERIDLEVVAGCAFALRYRETRAQARHDERVEKVREARRTGREWVVLGESGSAGDGSVPYPEPYDRLEMHLPDGAGFHAYVDLDPDTGRPRYCLQVVKLDPETGAWVADEGEPRTFRDPSAWRDEVDRERRRLSTSSA